MTTPPPAAIAEVTPEPQEAATSSPAAAIPRGRRPVLVIGGGRVGRELAQHFPTLTILEKNEAKIPMIQIDLPKATVVHGSGSNPEHLAQAGIEGAGNVVLATNSDDANYKCARVARRLVSGDTRIWARLDDESNRARFQALGVEPVLAPLAAAANQLSNLIEPERRSIVEAVVTDTSPVVGKLVSELPVDGHTSLISILRNEELLPPAPETKIAAGDVLTLVTTDVKAGVLERFSGHESGIDPLSRLYVPLVDEYSITGPFREAFVLAARTNATVYTICHRKRHELADEAKRLGALQQVKVHTHLVETDPMEALDEIVSAYDTKHARSRKVAGLVFDGVVVARDPLPPWFARPFRRSTAEAILARLPGHPVLVAASTKPYRSIILVIDDSPRTRIKVAYAIDLALTFSSKIVALSVEGHATDKSHHLLQYLKRAGRAYGVEVEERPVRGNPVLEVVLEVRHGDHDLVILEWDSPTIKKEFVRRIVTQAPQSVLLVP